LVDTADMFSNDLHVVQSENCPRHLKYALLWDFATQKNYFFVKTHDHGATRPGNGRLTM
jgi:hypothetical protein